MYLSNLRKRLNDFSIQGHNIGASVNDSWLGQKFERSLFAISIEHAIQMYFKCMASSNLNIADKIGLTIVEPIAPLIGFLEFSSYYLYYERGTYSQKVDQFIRYTKPSYRL